MTGPPPSLPTPRRLESWASASNAASAAATARKGTTSSRRSARTWRGPRSAEDTSSATKRPDQSAVWRMKTKGSLATGVCVCVPGQRVSLPPFHTPFTHRFNRRGQRDLQLWPLPTKLHTGRSGKRTCAVTLLHSSVLCFDAMGPSCYHPETGFLPQICSSLAATLSATENTVKPYCCRRLFHLAVLSPFLPIGKLS